MWLFLNDAFLSIVQHKDDPDTLLVRARRHEDLSRFLSSDPDANCVEIQHTPEADYPFRALVPRLLVGEMMADQVMRIDYPNFKGSIEPADSGRGEAYGAVWSVMRTRLDPREA